MRNNKKQIITMITGFICIILIILFIIYHKKIIDWFFVDVLGNLIKIKED